MDLAALPLTHRIQAVSRVLSPVAAQIADALQEDAGLIDGAEALLQGTSLPKEMADAFLERTRSERLELANKHARELQDLWQRTVSEARTRWGNDAVDAVLEQLTVTLKPG